MNERELLGATAATLIARNHLAGDGQARLLLDRLGPEQVAAICRAVIAHPELTVACCIRVPHEIGAKTGLPDEILTRERTTYWRHQQVEGFRVLLLANDDDQQAQSLGDLTPVGSAQLLAEPALWVASAGLSLSTSDEKTWTAALQGLLQARSHSVDRFAEYAVATRAAVAEGMTVERALGHALPALQAPRDQSFFVGISSATKGQAAKWRAAYLEVFRKRAPYLLKKHPTEQPIGVAELRDNYEKSRDAIAEERHALVEGFIEAPPTWCPAVRAFAELEWEGDGVKALFENLKKKKQKLGALTRDLFDEKLPTEVTDEERQYLTRFDQRSGRESELEDEEFYERHRYHLALDPRVKAQWERHVFGRPIETDDLRLGLLQAVARLFDQLGERAGRKSLTVECHRLTARQWEDVNDKAARYFTRRYRGLVPLFGRDVRWKPENLFDVAATEPTPRAGKKKAEGRSSTAKAANQVKFTVRLCALGHEDDAVSTQVIWTFDPRSILTAFAGDWDHLRDHPFAASLVTRELVSAKGRLQSIDLRDVQTLMPVGRQTRGSLLARRDRDAIDARFEQGLRDGAAKGWLSLQGHAAITQCWQEFAEAYRGAIGEYLQHGTAPDACVQLDGSYGRLVDALIAHASSDVGRSALWRPLFDLGVASVEGGDCASIVAPWHPLRIVAAAVKDRRLGGLVRYLLREESVEFGDPRLFFRDMAAELAHPFYPEVCVGYQGERPTLLACSDNHGEYSLMEPATRGTDARERASTNDDPREAAKVIRYIVGQFLALYPHEAANLSLVLYNCDTVGLPETAVAMLGEMYGEDDARPVRCHVQLRHTEQSRLQDLYETLLEASARDTDSAVASESSRDFMARLRVGIMADQSPSPTRLDGMPADIVFLQDVVARLCALRWIDQGDAMTVTEPTALVPSQWSRRRPAMRDDLHSTTDLCCPVQSPAGWSFLRGARGLVEGEAPDASSHPLPTRKVSFDHGRARTILDDAHKLGQWVVNFDEILTRQHLRNLDVRIIRYRQAAGGERGVIVSSRAPLNMLHMLVRRNLASLGLPLSNAELGTLAERLVDYASQVSGDIVLRAARRSAFAHELIGLALSRYLLADELGEADTLTGWYFLDDYADWLGQREGHLADIMALGIRRDGSGAHSLVALVSEAKYVSASVLLEQSAHSGRQTEETLGRMESALFSTPRRLDRDQWLMRLAELLADSGMSSPSTQTSRQDLQGWQRDIAAGRMGILLRGYSHVFVYAKSPEDDVTPSREPLGGDVSGWQEIFGPAEVRRLLLAFHQNRSPRAEREVLARDTPWRQGVARRPAEGANWATTISTLELLPLLQDPPSRPAVVEPPSPPRRGRPPRAASSSAPPSSTRPSGAPPSAAALSVAPPPRVSSSVPPPPPVGDAGFGWASPRLAALLEGAAASAEPSPDALAWMEQVTIDLTSALRSYKLQAQRLDARLTPNAVRVRFRGSDQLTVQSVEQQVGKLLTTHKLKVIRVAAEPGEVVVFVARPARDVVSLPSALRGRLVDDPAGRHNERLVVGLRERDGSTLYLHPGRAHAPHTLIAGTTGSGKSVLIQNLILDIAMTNAPSSAKVTIIDPKMGVDYQILARLPHVGGEVVTEQPDAIEALNALVQQMDDRYRLFSGLGIGVNDIYGYNRHVAPRDRLPTLWVVHDEFADWMLIEEYKSSVLGVVQRLGVKARAAGIRLIFAAQRPENSVMPVQLRNNLNNKLILRVDDEGTSTISLGERGAERLLGRGHLAARLPDEDGIVLAQVPMLSPELTAQVVSAVCAEAVMP